MAIPGFDPSNFAFPDIGKMMEQFKVPGIDVGKIVEAQRKDIEALTQANQAAYAGVQELAKRQAEILQETMAEWQAAMSRMGSGDTSAQAELAQKALGKAVNNMREMAELTAKSQTQAWEVIQKRFRENLADMMKLMQPPK